MSITLVDYLSRFLNRKIIMPFITQISILCLLFILINFDLSFSFSSSNIIIVFKHKFHNGIRSYSSHENSAPEKSILASKSNNVNIIEEDSVVLESEEEKYRREKLQKYPITKLLLDYWITRNIRSQSNSELDYFIIFISKIFCVCLILSKIEDKIKSFYLQEINNGQLLLQRKRGG